MTLQDLMKRIDQLAEDIAKLDAMLAPDKGGEGSGCTGPNCGRPRTGNDRKPSGRITDPNDDGPILVSGSNEIKPREDKPRSGVRPSALKPKKDLDEETLRIANEFMEQYSGLMEDLAKIEEHEKQELLRNELKLKEK